MNGSAEIFGRDAWARVGHHVRLFASTSEGRKAIAMLALLVAALVSFNVLNVFNSYVGRDFMSAIERRDAPAFAREAWQYVLVFAASTLVAVTWRYVEERLGLLWRNWQTRQLLDRYLAHRVYYRIEADGMLANPDQRIAEDVRTFTTTTLSFAILMLNASFTIVAFAGVLWSISPLLFAVAVGYAVAGSLLTVLLGRRLIGLNNLQLDKEANFRNELVLTRDNATALALLNGEDHVHRRLLDRLAQIVANTRRMISIDRNLNGFTNGYNYLVQIIPALIVAPMFMRGQVQFGVVTQAAMAFSTLMGAFSLAVTQFQSISTYAAVVGRLGKLVEAIDRAEHDAAPVELIEEDGRLVYEQLTLRRADGRVLVAGLNLDIAPDARVLVTGAAGEAESDLFKATAGLLRTGAGRIRRPGPQTMQFVPDEPFLPRGTVRELLRLDGNAPLTDDAAIGKVLALLGLDTAIARHGGLDSERDWNLTLDMGERAHLILARLLLGRPKTVFFDRMSVALHRPQAVEVLRLLRERGIGYLVVGQRDDAGPAFDSVLDIATDGSWSCKPVEPALVASGSVA